MTVVAMTLMTLLLAGCSDTTDSDSTNDPEPAGQAGQSGEPEPDSYLFAVAGPMSGDTVVYGENLRKGVDFAVEEINANGGIGGEDLSVKYFDDECDPTIAANAANAIVSEDDVFGVIGHVCSVATAAGLPIYAEAGLAATSPSSTAPNLTEQGYDNFARTIPSDTIHARQLAEFVVGVLGGKRLAVLYATDDYGQGLYDVVGDAVDEYDDTQIVAAETFVPADTRDFTSQLTNIAAEDPDVLLLLGFYTDMGTAVSQLSRVGLEEVVLAGPSGVAQQDYADLGGERAEGTYVLGYYDPENPIEENLELGERFESATGEALSEQAAFGYEIVQMYKIAIENGATRSTLASALRELQYDGPTGSNSFDEKGDVIGKASIVLRVRDGALTLDQEATGQLAEVVE